MRDLHLKFRESNPGEWEVMVRTEELMRDLQMIQLLTIWRFGVAYGKGLPKRSPLPDDPYLNARLSLYEVQLKGLPKFNELLAVCKTRLEDDEVWLGRLKKVDARPILENCLLKEPGFLEGIAIADPGPTK